MTGSHRPPTIRLGPFRGPLSRASGPPRGQQGRLRWYEGAV